MEAVAKLRNLSISPTKVRLVVDLVRNKSLLQGLEILKHTQKKCAIHIKKLLLSAIANWEQKYDDAQLEDLDLRIKEIKVDCATMLKRMRPAAQGRGHRIRKRSCHVTLRIEALKVVEIPDTSDKSEVIREKKIGTKALKENKTQA